MTLEEIKSLKDHRTPELSDEVLEQQIEKIEGEIEGWVRAGKLLRTIRKTINSVSYVDENEITIQFLPAEAIVLGDINDYSRGRTIHDALLSFYNSMNEKYPTLDLNYPVWAAYSESSIKSRAWVEPDRFYFYNPEGHDRRAATLYAIGYTRGGYGKCDELYRMILEFIDKHGFEICGPTYEEYPLNEVCVADENRYLIRIMITVRKK